MSEFKFACPVCGQHITCDSASSGMQMDCPTCFRKLVVPHVTGSQNFVLTATEVQSRPSSTLENSNAARTRSSGKRSIALVLGALVVLAVIGLGGVFVANKMLGGTAENNSSQNSANEARTNGFIALNLTTPAPDATNWTLNLAVAKIPSTPASGVVHGFGFNLDRAVIRAGKLDLRQGPEWPPNVGLTIHLFANNSEDLAGKTVVLESTRTNAPRIILRWKDDQGKAVTKDFRQGYAARVVFGSVSNDHLSGEIYLAAPDEFKSYVAGTFSAEIRKSSPPKKP